MLTLSLLRHAKSSWADPARQDFDRPLNQRGRDAAPRMGAFMRRHDIAPQLVLCSPAVRARQTLELVLPHLPHPPAVLYEDALYLAAAPTLIKRVRGLDAAGAAHAMVVGHDPGLQRAAVRLAGSGEPELLAALAAKLPTAGLAVIVFDAGTWADVRAGAGRLALFMTPKRLA
jgi:phosphohistidine phosphatase